MQKPEIHYAKRRRGDVKMRENKMKWRVWYSHCMYIRHSSSILCPAALIGYGANLNAAVTTETWNGALTSEI